MNDHLLGPAGASHALPANTIKLIALLTEVTQTLFSGEPAPKFVSYSHDESGFRYERPSPLLFCLLKIARAVSALNAMKLLFDGGYLQEICVLCRTVTELTSNAEFVATSMSEGLLTEDAQRHVDDFFADLRRSLGSGIPRNKLEQRHVNEILGNQIDEVKRATPDWQSQMPSEFRETPALVAAPASELMRDSYMRYSAYVHGRYPEIMDMIGGVGPTIHLEGTKGTPKDTEASQIIATFTETVSLCLKIVIAKFEIEKRFISSPRLGLWFRSPTESYL